MYKISHLCSLQGGGPGSDGEDVADPFNGRFTVCMFLPMEVITVSEKRNVVEVSSLTEIPSELQVRQAISKLHKEHPDKFSYITFPFGMMDYDGLKMLAKYHEYVALRKNIAEEKDWLKQSKQNCGELGINIDEISQHFQMVHNSVRTLVGKRWLSDDIIDIAFDARSMMILFVSCASRPGFCTHQWA